MGRDDQPLLELSLTELWELFPIRVVSWSAEYAQWYQDAAQELSSALGSGLVRISHIGSTAVPGLAAKPTVDILAELAHRVTAASVNAVLSQDWLLQHEQTDPYWELLFGCGYTSTGFADRVFHLHLRVLADWDELYFRDYLLDHPDSAAEYATLKESLAARFATDRDSYTAAKSEFVQRVTRLGRAAYPGRYLRTGGAAGASPANGRTP